MKTYTIIEIMGDFSTLVNTTIESDNIENAKKKVMKEVQENINKYMYAVVEEGDN